MAPKSRTPSRPRLILPLFSVRHSPRLTKRKGVPPRNAPAMIARGTPNQPIPVLAPIISQWSCLVFPEDLPSSVQAFAKKNHQKHQPLKNHDRGIRQMMVPLQDAAAGQQPTQQDRNQDASERILAGQKCHEDATVTVPG